MDERKFTLIVVPDGGLETRSYKISYPRLQLIVYASVAVVLCIALMVGLWFPIAAQAARARKLEVEVARLEQGLASVAELERALDELEIQYERVRALLGADGAVGDDSPPVLPPLRRGTPREAEASDAGESLGVIDTWPLESRGFITQVLSESRPNHPGLDIAVAENSYIRAAGTGIVREVGNDRVYGHFAVIDHGGGLESLYGHASRILVSPGNRVRGNDVIGLTGSTGQSTGPHLHFEVRRDGRAVDPLQFVRQP